MKSIKLAWVAALTLLTVLAIQVRLAAQDNRDPHHKHHHYKLIDLGTFGGPQSFTQEQLHFLTNQGTVAGWADTSAGELQMSNQSVKNQQVTGFRLPVNLFCADDDQIPPEFAPLMN